MAAALKFACALVMCMVLAAPMANALTCGEVVGAVQPCMEYLRFGGAPPFACCGGVKSLLGQARTIIDRRTICYCLKTAAEYAHGLKLAHAASLLEKCGVYIPYKISPSIDCESVM